MNIFFNKTAVISGAASGIGKALVKLAHHYKMKIVLIDNNHDGLRKIEEEFSLKPSHFFMEVMDVRNQQAWENLAHKTANSFGSIHYIFNNAGVGGPMCAAWQVEQEILKWVMDVNFYAPISAIQAFLPYLFQQKDRSRIINVASMAGFYTAPYLSAYEASKHAIIAWSEAFYLDLIQQKKPIDVSIVAPGWVHTGILNHNSHAPKSYEKINSDLYSEEDAKWIFAFAKNIKRGISPDMIAEKIFSGIVNNDFYILTHPEMKHLILERMQGILDEKDPSAWALYPHPI